MVGAEKYDIIGEVTWDLNMKSRKKKVKNNVKVQSMNKPVVGAERDKAARKHVSRKLVLSIIVALLVVANLVMGIVAICLSHSQPVVPDGAGTEIVEEPEEPEEPEDETNTEDLVDEPEVTDATEYQVAPNKPRYLTIASIGLINVPVTEFGVTNGNQLGSPKSIRVVGWFYQSAFPGKQGVTVMNGHGGDLGNGIFRPLPRVQIGDEVVIEMGDGRKYTYVIREKVYKKLGTEANNYMPTALYKALGEGVPTLTLITCTGNWLPAQQTYDQRLFVRASLRTE